MVIIQPEPIQWSKTSLIPDKKMTKSNNQKSPKLLGPDNMTAQQIRELPEKERHKYISKMSAQEFADYMAAWMVDNLNATKT